MSPALTVSCWIFFSARMAITRCCRILYRSASDGTSHVLGSLRCMTYICVLARSLRCALRMLGFQSRVWPCSVRSNSHPFFSCASYTFGSSGTTATSWISSPSSAVSLMSSVWKDTAFSEAGFASPSSSPVSSSAPSSAASMDGASSPVSSPSPAVSASSSSPSPPSVAENDLCHRASCPANGRARRRR